MNEIAHQYLMTALDNSESIGLKVVEAHFTNCCTEAYIIADVDYDLDAFSLIKRLGIVHERFSSIRFPQMEAFYRKQRAKRIALLKRRT